MAEGPVQRAIDAVRDLYTSNLEEHGTTSKSVGWRDAESQTLRFDQLAHVIPEDGRPFSVADWGCGYGAMFAYLAERYGARLTGYTGCDISPQMIEAARAQHDDPRARFELGNTAAEADYTFVSGTFNVRFEADGEAWKAWIRERVTELWQTSQRGLAFNLLSTYVDWQEPQLFYGDPKEFFDLCATELSRHVALLHDYPLYEWTIAVRRA